MQIKNFLIKNHFKSFTFSPVIESGFPILQAVAESSDGLDISIAVFTQFSAQFADTYHDIIVRYKKIISPAFFEQLLFREYFAGVLHKKFHQFEFHGGQLDDAFPLHKPTRSEERRVGKEC